MSPFRRRLCIEPLEDRRLLSVTWYPQGPGPILDGQASAFPDDQVVGAVEALAVDPSDPNIVYAGTVAGGVWKTANFLSDYPRWTPLTDQQQSLAIGALALSPLDPSHQTLFAGTGNFISGGPNGRAIGILRTTDGGTNWQLLAQNTLAGRQIRSVVPTAIGGDLQNQVVLVAAVSGGGVYWSTDGGSTFTLLSGSSGEGDGLDNDANGFIDEPGELNLPFGNASHLVGDPGSSTRFFAAIPGQGIYRSTTEGGNAPGAHWTKVSNSIPDMAATSRIELTVSAARNNTVYAALLSQDRLQAVYYSGDHGDTWAPVGAAPDVNPGAQGYIHFSIVADPTDANRVYVAGDRGGGLSGTLGQVYRGDTSDGDWDELSSWGSRPHADSRDMIFVAGGLVEADDGGVFAWPDPHDDVGLWLAKSYNLAVTEFYSVAYDHANDRIFGGTQDTGVPQQVSPGSWFWEEYTEGDGGTVDVGYFIDNGQEYSIRYSMGNNFNTFRRQVFDADGDRPFLLNLTLGGQADLDGLNNVDAAFEGFSVFPFVLNRFDSSRVVIGGNGLYESNDWAENLTILDVGGRTYATALAYGGMLGGVENDDVLYAGFAGDLLLRSTGGTTLMPTNYRSVVGTTPGDIVVDPDDWRRVYVTDGTRVHRSTDAGATWTTIGSVAGNLASFTDQLYSIELVSPPSLPGVQALLVGGRHGVYQTFNPDAGAAAVWSEVGWNLPNAPVKDLRYEKTDDVLLAGTFGRGAWTLPNASQAFLPDLRGYWVDVPDKIDWEETFSLTGAVVNYGEAPTTKRFTQRFYLSDNLTFSETDWYLGSYSHTDLIPQGGLGPFFSVTLTLPTRQLAGFTGDGPFYIGMWTDRDQEIAESNEANNLPPVGGLTIDYDRFTIPPSADLRGWSALVPTTIDWGETFDVLGQVHNSGTLSVTSDFRQQFFLAPDEVWGDGDEIFLGDYLHTADVPGPGVGPTFLATLTLPSSPPPGFSGAGPFYIGMTTDALNNVAETDETNNFPGSLGVGYDFDSFNVPGYYDLRGGYVSVPSPIAWGETFTVQARVGNDGSLPVTTDFEQQFFLGADQIWGNGEERFLIEYLHTADVPANGVGPAFEVTLTLPGSPPAGFSGNGPFYIGMTTDTDNDVAETNEANNFPGSYGLGVDHDVFYPLTNDDFAFRIALGSVRSIARFGSNVGFSGEIGEPAQSGDIHSAWWSWTAPADGALTIDTFGSDFDTYLTLATGSAVDSLNVLAQNDDSGGTLQSRIADGSVTAGTQYQIAVDGYLAAKGNITLNLSFTNNDNFSDRIDLGSARSVTDTGSNGGFAGEAGEPPQSGPIHSAWWSWTAPADGALTIDTFGSDFDTYLTLAAGSAVDALGVLAQNDDSGGTFQSQIADLFVTAGTQYQIAVDGYQTTMGNITLNLSFTNNDNFADRIGLGLVSAITVSGSNGGFTGETGEPVVGPVIEPINSAWWSWFAPDDGVLTLATFGSDFDTWLSLWTGSSVDNLTLVAETDDSGGLQSRLEAIVTAGSQYQIAVDGYGAATGNISLHLSFAPALPNVTPYQPPGWSEKIVVSKQPGTNTEDSPWYSTDTLYMDWSVINNGTAETLGDSFVDLYLDGEFLDVFVVPPLLSGSDHRVYDYRLGTLSPGPHTLTIVVDSTGMIEESNEADNQYERTFVVAEGVGAIRVVVDTVPDSPQDFVYTGSLGTFLLDDDDDPALPSRRTFSELASGPYLIAQDPLADWGLSALVISGDLDGGSSIDLVNRIALLDLDPGEFLSVRFITRRLGDYNLDGVVDGADYYVWRSQLGQTAAGLAADGDLDGDVDGDDFRVWQAHLDPGSTIQVLFSEDFYGAVPQTYGGGPIPGSQFQVTAANVDVIGVRNGSFFTCDRVPSANCLDLVGNSGAGGITSVPTFDLTARTTYFLDVGADLQGYAPGDPVTSRFTVSLGSLSQTLTAVAAGEDYRLTFTPQMDEPGARLTFSTISAPDPVHGAVLDHIVLFTSNTPTSGDFNGDGLLDCTDADLLVAAIARGSGDLTFDLNGDALLTLDDVDLWRVLAGAANLPDGAPYLPGDGNLDGVVDVSDFNVWNANKFAYNAAWCRGDFSADGVIDASDFNIWNSHKFLSSLERVGGIDQGESMDWAGQASRGGDHGVHVIGVPTPVSVGYEAAEAIWYEVQRISSYPSALLDGGGPMGRAVVWAGHKKPCRYFSRAQIPGLAIDYVATTYPIAKSSCGDQWHLRDPWFRAVQAIPLNIAEGNGKQSLGDQKRFCDIARGSALECAAIHNIVNAVSTVDAESHLWGKSDLKRIMSMLTRLIRRGDRVSEVSVEYENEYRDAAYGGGNELAQAWACHTAVWHAQIHT